MNGPVNSDEHTWYVCCRFPQHHLCKVDRSRCGSCVLLAGGTSLVPQANIRQQVRASRPDARFIITETSHSTLPKDWLLTATHGQAPA